MLSNQKHEIYELVHFLVRETDRLRDLVFEARDEANAVAPWRNPYPMVGENAYNGSFDNHPAMLRYFQLYDPSF
jgi:hypothetical protein